LTWWRLRGKIIPSRRNSLGGNGAIRGVPQTAWKSQTTEPVGEHYARQRNEVDTRMCAHCDRCVGAV